MSGYENVVGGKLKLKGKALNVKAGGMKKKKKHKKQHDHDQVSQLTDNELSADKNTEELSIASDDVMDDSGKLSKEGKAVHYEDHLTPAERRYMEQRGQIDVHRMAKEANKSHRDRIQDFNQYLANMSEHYDIPKVGPG
ncbi:protein FAM32A-like [Jatropha curcas]|uniref:protein FAM32A-like n=1 Tax=Jatropha curcas TaxID=180498 RepID=UPI0005FB97BD|nr:protein FAM32A-like [Jatropha curcas]XP_012087325.1 protein FAM32A-like [Jatropha curcas]XP_012087326.1 protein FAM32A-like [Jatropha curcas]